MTPQTRSLSTGFLRRKTSFGSTTNCDQATKKHVKQSSDNSLDTVVSGQPSTHPFIVTILDEGKVTIGNHVFIGPNVSLYTACHPTDPIERRKGTEWTKPITIGNDVWIGGNVTILPGVTIGNGSTIGAGSVVIRDIPEGSIAVGNPCRVVKTIIYSANEVHDPDHKTDLNQYEK